MALISPVAPGEFTGAAIDVYGVIDDGEARLRQGHSCGCGLIEGDGVAGFSYPVMLHFEQDVVAGDLRSTEIDRGAVDLAVLDTWDPRLVP
jgi:hypothetical protein